ncbi:unnamed protein product [Tuber aestivum]|uniref:Agmatinase n=1 Tax=Tuber aestivum TaxID=59557 RepID=A0A292Q3G7_9PEZI|nr:unnamed protein product [Tuber aestivum]
MKFPLLLLLSFLSLALSHAGKEYTEEDISNLRQKWASEHPFGGISTFAHLPHVHCLTSPHEGFDIAILGAPFDTAVTYRPGARFGPRAIRAASARQSESRGFNVRAGINPYLSDVKLLDCGDIPISPFDNELALRQMTEAYKELMSRSTPSGRRPIIVTLGGDHSIALAALRGVNSVYGPVSVVHFDAHIDTWHPTKYTSSWPTLQSTFTHGSMFYLAYNESLLLPTSNIHAGLRSRLSGADMSDYADDDAQGWARISTDDIDDIGVAGIVKRILEHVGNNKVYLSIDIDVLDPGTAPGTGTPEAGGWTTRELIRIIRGIEGLDVVGVDVVEVAPAYDWAESTALAASQVVFEVLSSLAKKAGAALRVEAEARDEL